jgi:transcriptional regulator with XRE-family HTH domain
MLARMDDARIGRTVRILRQRRGWRQRDLGLHAGISKAAISDIERGRVDRYTLATIRRVLRSLSATVELYATWGGAGDLDRLLDADHALVVELWAGRHQAAGWELLPEASYSIFGERGRIDLLAFHPATGVLEVAECKTGIWDVQDTIGRLDAKVRLARRVAAERGWRVSRVVPALVIAEGRTARRRIAQHSSLFGRFECRGHSALAFVRDPTRPAGALLFFLTLPKTNQGSLRRAGQRRVRPRTLGPRADPPKMLPPAAVGGR